MFDCEHDIVGSGDILLGGASVLYYTVVKILLRVALGCCNLNGGMVRSRIPRNVSGSQLLGCAACTAVHRYYSPRVNLALGSS